jgi:hypothetical protein
MECLSGPTECHDLAMRWVTSIETVALPFPGAFREEIRIDRRELGESSSYGLY